MKSLATINKLGNFFSRFIEVYQKQKSVQCDGNTHQLKYKIASSYEDYRKSGKVLIQARRGSAYIQLTPSEVLKNVDLLSFLHPIDASIITKLYHESSAEVHGTSAIAEFKYMGEELSKETPHIKVLNKATDTIETICLESFIKHANLLNKFNAEDSMKIGWLLGSIHEKHISKLK